MIVQLCISICNMDVDHSKQILAINIVGEAFYSPGLKLHVVSHTVDSAQNCQSVQVFSTFSQRVKLS